MKKKFLIPALACLLLASCSKNDSPNNPTPNNNNNNPNPTTEPILLYRMKNTQNELWSINGDGSNNHKINIALPAGWQLKDEDMAEMNSDGSSIILLANNGTGDGIFKCNMDGSNVTQIYTEPNVSLGIQDIVSNSSVLYCKHVGNDLDLYMVNLDGSNNHKININLPSNSIMQEEELAKASNDGQYIYFLGQDTSANQTTIYKSSINGTNVAAINIEPVNISMAIQCVSNNKVYFRKRELLGNINELWSVNVDGTSKQHVNIPLQSGQLLRNEEMAKAKMDGEAIYFLATNASNVQGIFKFVSTGTTTSNIFQAATNQDIAIQSLK